MRYPALFVNHGGGPLPLLGRQPDLVHHMKETVTKWLPSERPKAIVVVSAHWETEPIQITSSPNPSMYFDYYGFPPETYEYQYPAPGHPELAHQIQELIQDKAGMEAQLNESRGFDHGVFIPLMIMYPKADIPVVCVSLHKSLSAETHWNLGRALSPLRDQGMLILGSGYAFHNLKEYFNPTEESLQGSAQFNDWLKETLLIQPLPPEQSTKTTTNSRSDTTTTGSCSLDEQQEQLVQELKAKILAWDTAPGARLSHPREEHLLPLFVTAAAGCMTTTKMSSTSDNGEETQTTVTLPKTTLVYDSSTTNDNSSNMDKGKHGQGKILEHAVSGYMFE